MHQSVLAMGPRLSMMMSVFCICIRRNMLQLQDQSLSRCAHCELSLARVLIGFHGLLVDLSMPRLESLRSVWIMLNRFVQWCLVWGY